MAQKKGRGWHGNSAAHAAAGRKGGLASRRGKSSSKIADTSSSTEDMQIEDLDQASM